MFTCSPKDVYFSIIAFASNRFKVYPLTVGQEIQLALCDEIELIVIRENEEDLKVNLVDTLNKQELCLGKVIYGQSPGAILKSLAGLVHKHMFHKVMTVHGLDDIFSPDHEFNEQTYDRLVVSLNKNNLIKIKTHCWKQWCRAMMTEIENKYYNLEKFQNTQVSLFLK